MAKTYKPAYADLVQINKALDLVVRSYKGWRDELQSILNSAVAHDLACRDKGGSVQTVLTKVFARIDTEMEVVNSRHVLSWLRAIYGKTLAWKEGKNGKFAFTLGKNIQVSGIIKDTNEDGEEIESMYFELPFWEYSTAKADRPVWSFGVMLERILTQAQNREKKGELSKEDTTLAHVMRDVAGALNLQVTKEGNKITGHTFDKKRAAEIATVSSKMIGGKQAEAVH